MVTSDHKKGLHMAFALSKFLVTFSIIGVNDGERSKEVEFIPNGADLPAQRLNLAIGIAGWMTDFNGVNSAGSGASGCWIESYSSTEIWYEETAVPSFVGWEDVYKEVTVTAQLDNSPDKGTISIPAPRNILFVGDSFNTDDVDSASAELLAFAGNYQNDGTEIATLRNGQQWQSPINVLGASLRSVRSGKSY